LVVNVVGSLDGANDMVLGNIVGSNIANILLILGLTAGIKSLSIPKSTVWKEIPFALLGALVLAILINDQYFNYASFSSLSAADGVILLCFFVIFMYYTFSIAQQNDDNQDQIKEMSHPKSALFVL